jgi:hypothetical protein
MKALWGSRETVLLEKGLCSNKSLSKFNNLAVDKKTALR